MPSIIAQDTFDRTPGDLINVGKPEWMIQAGSSGSMPRVLSYGGQLTASMTAGGDSYVRYRNQTYTDVSITADCWRRGGEGGGAGNWLMARINPITINNSTRGNFYALRWQIAHPSSIPNEAYQIVRCHTSSPWYFPVATVLGEWTEPRLPEDTKRTLRFDLEGETLSAYVDGVKRIEVQDSVYKTGSVGFGQVQVKAALDNFQATALTPVPRTMTPSDFWGFWDATDPNNVVLNSSSVPTQWLDISGNNKHHSLTTSTSYNAAQGYLQNNGSYICRTLNVMPDSGASSLAYDWALTHLIAWGSDWGNNSVQWISGCGSAPRTQGYGTFGFSAYNGSNYPGLSVPGHAENTFYPITYFRQDNAMGFRTMGANYFLPPSTTWPYSATFWQLLSGRYRAKRAAVYYGTVNDEILKSVDRLMLYGQDVEPEVSVFWSPHLANHFDQSQLLSSPHLLGSFP